jgi:alanyl-tRNA synthetase
MLGNFSFGDYFKDDAIAYAWELITKNFGLPKDKLLVTIYHDDDRAADIWKKVAGLSDDRIIRIATSDNFWSMGDTGPCGPCSEIFFDHGEDIPGGPPGSPDEDGDRFIEIWNLVFMQYEQVDKDTRIELPKPSIDTGMGLERIAAILQGEHNNYEIDLMKAIIEHSADLTSVDAKGAQSSSHRVIADHLRSSAFLLADGVMPSNEGRGYVLRRIMRRAMRHAHLLGASDPLLYRLLPTLVAQMGEAYPELKRAESLISETLKLEETRFKKTLDRGLRMLDDEAEAIGEGGTLAGDVAFKLYDTYGFPVDLSADALKAKNIAVDMDGFNTSMEAAREEARKSWSGSGDAAHEKIWFEVERKTEATEFLGYDKTVADAQLLAIVKEGQMVESASQGDTVSLVLNQTPFYAESGGQVADHGVIENAAEGVFANVTNVQKKPGGLFAHEVTLEKGTIKTGQTFTLKVDETRRNATRAHHSATHILHEALRQRLGDHVAQKGSLVAPDRLRFDITQPTPLNDEDIAIVEAQVNEEIRANTAVETRVMPLEETRESGARALFGEKYDDEVRVVSMGRPMPDGSRPYSIELCGGTHVKRTGDIGAFVFTSESAVSAGVRRIEGLTGDAALSYMKQRNTTLEQAAQALKVPASDVANRVQSLLEEKKKLEKDLSEMRRKLATSGADAGGASGGNAADVKDLGGVKFTARVLQDIPAKDLKPMADDLKAQLGSGVITLIAVNEGKASIVVGVTEDLTDRISAVDLVRIGAEALGGKGGGGRPDMAQAGGPDGNAANDAVANIERNLAG